MLPISSIIVFGFVSIAWAALFWILLAWERPVPARRLALRLVLFLAWSAGALGTRLHVDVALQAAAAITVAVLAFWLLVTQWLDARWFDRGPVLGQVPGDEHDGQ